MFYFKYAVAGVEAIGCQSYTNWALDFVGKMKKGLTYYYLSTLETAVKANQTI